MSAHVFVKKVEIISIFQITPLKRQAEFVADDIYFYFFNFSMKTSLDISCESSAMQTIHMKYQDFFSLKN